MGNSGTQQSDKAQNLVDEYIQKFPEGDKYLGFENVSPHALIFLVHSIGMLCELSDSGTLPLSPFAECDLKI